jgi:hypothetical protein
MALLKELLGMLTPTMESQEETVEAHDDALHPAPEGEDDGGHDAHSAAVDALMAGVESGEHSAADVIATLIGMMSEDQVADALELLGNDKDEDAESDEAEAEAEAEAEDAESDEAEEVKEDDECLDEGTIDSGKVYADKINLDRTYECIYKDASCVVIVPIAAGKDAIKKIRDACDSAQKTGIDWLSKIMSMAEWKLSNAKKVGTSMFTTSYKEVAPSKP